MTDGVSTPSPAGRGGCDVTLDGVPVANAIVQFMPERRDGQAAVDFLLAG